MCEIIGLIDRATGELAQEVAYLRLVATNQFPESPRVLRADSQGNEVLILAFQRCCCVDYCSRPVKRHMIK